MFSWKIAAGSCCSSARSGWAPAVSVRAVLSRGEADKPSGNCESMWGAAEPWRGAVSPAGDVGTGLVLSSTTWVTQPAALWGPGCFYPGLQGTSSRYVPSSSHTFLNYSQGNDFSCCRGQKWPSVQTKLAAPQLSPRATMLRGVSDPVRNRTQINFTQWLFTVINKLNG